MQSAPWIFIMGAPRSGTTLLRQVLSRHPRLFISHEVRILDLAYLTAVLAEHNGTAPPEASVTPRALLLGQHYTRLLAHHQLQAMERARYGDKYPPYCLTVEALGQLFPDAVFLHILRDGRDVVASAARTRTANRGWRRSPAIPPTLHLIRDWVGFVQRARAAGSALGPARYHEVRYEHLLTSPAAVLRGICTFLGEPFAPELLEGTADFHPGKDWHQTLSAAELLAFHEAPGAEALLQRLGYAPTPHPHDHAVERAAGLRPAPTSPVAARLEAGEDTPALWRQTAEAALAQDDPHTAIAALVRAIRGSTPDPVAIDLLLAQSDAPESVFAAMNALEPGTLPAHRASLARWAQARGLDAAASAALFPVEDAR